MIALHPEGLYIRVRCRSVDHNGFNGRDHHPEDRHIGRTFLVVKAWIDDVDGIAGEVIGIDNITNFPTPPQVARWLDMEENTDDDRYLDCNLPYTVLQCVDKDTGEQVEFILHEVEFLP